jgi:hypothetical protein
VNFLTIRSNVAQLLERPSFPGGNFACLWGRGWCSFAILWKWHRRGEESAEKRMFHDLWVQVKQPSSTKHQLLIMTNFSYCRSLFRSIINFVAHKRTICRSLQSSLRAEQLETFRDQQSKIQILKKNLKMNNWEGSSIGATEEGKKKNLRALRRFNPVSSLSKHIRPVKVRLEKANVIDESGIFNSFPGLNWHLHNTSKYNFCYNIQFQADIEVQTLARTIRPTAKTTIVDGRQVHSTLTFVFLTYNISGGRRTSPGNFHKRASASQPSRFGGSSRDFDPLRRNAVAPPTFSSFDQEIGRVQCVAWIDSRRSGNPILNICLFRESLSCTDCHRWANPISHSCRFHHFALWGWEVTTLCVSKIFLIRDSSSDDSFARLSQIRCVRDGQQPFNDLAALAHHLAIQHQVDYSEEGLLKKPVPHIKCFLCDISPLGRSTNQNLAYSSIN